MAPLNDDAVLAMATRLAGGNRLLLRVQAARALERQAVARGGGLAGDDWCRTMAMADAARALAALVAVPEAQGALRAALKPGTTWLEPVLGQLAGVPRCRWCWPCRWWRRRCR